MVFSLLLDAYNIIYICALNKHVCGAVATGIIVNFNSSSNKYIQELVRTLLLLYSISCVPTILWSSFRTLCLSIYHYMYR
jgi:hypothetical protein